MCIHTLASRGVTLLCFEVFLRWVARFLSVDPLQLWFSFWFPLLRKGSLGAYPVLYLGSCLGVPQVSCLENKAVLGAIPNKQLTNTLVGYRAVTFRGGNCDVTLKVKG